ncbi:LysR family transcriptional regulator [Paenibacillus oenotherae]|uniref:LysR family transcriptional regulator n=1 Tax=Paenibacillus oenotherae TaxID=1435645 RepID=A0ABS7D855_9BACL|nr:LysR family transcriptional regulator [Paenibacillus oenotherae]MBW7476099.1 LysR family transcriptional regulator [Paenibacillus oenotherae]
MDLKQCRYFIAIAEERQITAAARRLHMAQPPLSQQLMMMERELGTALFERLGRHMELTDAGKKLYEYAVNMTKFMEEAIAEVREIGEGMRGKLTIGVNTLSDARLPGLLRTFRRRYPNITYKIQQNESRQLCALLADRAIELALVRLPVPLHDISMLPLEEEPFYFATVEPMELPEDGIAYRQIQSHPLLLPSTEGLGLYEFIIQQFTSRRLSPTILGECSDISVLMELVASGFGATIIPQSVLSLHSGHRLHSYPLQDTTGRNTSALIWSNNHYLSKPAQRFIDLVREKSGSSAI